MEQRSSKFLDCARLLRRLDEILAEGNGDGPEAGAVWNQMEEPWYALTEGEQQLLDLLFCELMRGTRSSRLPAALTRTACVTEEIMQGRFRQLLGL
jgi:hypothetical protein